MAVRYNKRVRKSNRSSYEKPYLAAEQAPLVTSKQTFPFLRAIAVVSMPLSTELLKCGDQNVTTALQLLQISPLDDGMSPCSPRAEDDRWDARCSKQC